MAGWKRHCNLISEVGEGGSGSARCLPGPEALLFAGSDDGGERCSDRYPDRQPQTKQPHPELYWRQVLERIADPSNASENSWPGISASYTDPLL